MLYLRLQFPAHVPAYGLWHLPRTTDNTHKRRRLHGFWTGGSGSGRTISQGGVERGVAKVTPRCEDAPDTHHLPHCLCPYQSRSRLHLRFCNIISQRHGVTSQPLVRSHRAIVILKVSYILSKTCAQNENKKYDLGDRKQQLACFRPERHIASRCVTSRC